MKWPDSFIDNLSKSIEIDWRFKRRIELYNPILKSTDYELENLATRLVYLVKKPITNRKWNVVNINYNLQYLLAACRSPYKASKLTTTNKRGKWQSAN